MASSTLASANRLPRFLNLGQGKILTVGGRRLYQNIFLILGSITSRIAQYYQTNTRFFYIYSMKNSSIVHWGDSWLHIAHSCYHSTREREWWHPNPNKKVKIQASQRKSICYMKSVLSSLHKLKIQTLMIVSRSKKICCKNIGKRLMRKSHKVSGA